VTIFRRGLHFGSFQGMADDPRQLARHVGDLAAAAEQAGFDALFVADHLMQGAIGGGREQPLIEAYTLLTLLSTRTESALLGALVSPITFHHPAHFAKQLTSLDLVSGGRAMAGMGAGWDADESAAFGIAFPPLGQRMDQLDEAMSIVSLMLRDERPTFSGQHYSINQPINLPRPLGSVPIVIGGSGEKRTLPLAAKHADVCNVLGDVDVLRHKFDVLGDNLEAVGRARDAC
jgi:alkanesulfonate monooxygenase SsuD/methylene tetrahydromethanopterin reductase-like flavin-dependent oxidoreductase (luciferase family)